VFYSSSIPHEVLKVMSSERHAITIWYYDKQERIEAVTEVCMCIVGNSSIVCTIYTVHVLFVVSMYV
jgi:hypothetical protein